MGNFEESLIYVLIILVALFAHPKYTYEFSTSKYAFLSLGAVILGVYLLFKLFKKKELKLFASPVHWLWLAFSFVSILSTYNTYRDNPYFFRQALDLALYMFLNVVIAFYFSTVMEKKDKIIKVLFVFILTGLVVAIDAILNFYYGKSIFLGNVGNPFDRSTIKSTIGNVIFVANYLNMLLPIALYFVFSFDLGVVFQSKKNNKDNKKQGGTLAYIFVLKIISLFSAILYLTAIVFSQTRSEYLALIGEVILFALFYFFAIRKLEHKSVQLLKEQFPIYYKRLVSLSKISFLILLIMAVLIVVGYNVPSPFNNYAGTSIVARFSQEDFVSSKDVRFLSWLSTLELWREHKLLGTGFGTYQYHSLFAIEKFMEKNPEYYYAWSNFHRAHNDYFQILGETGTLGFLIIVLMLLALTYYIFKNIRKIEDKDDSLLFVALVISGFVFAFQSVFSFPGHLLPNALAATFIISSGLGVYFNKSFGKYYVLKGLKAIVVAVLVLVLMFVATYLRWNHFISEVYFRDGLAKFTELQSIRSAILQHQNNLQMLSKYESDLSSFSGDFAVLSKDNWTKLKQQEAQRNNVRFDPIRAENERLAEINKLKADINNKRTQTVFEINKLSSLIAPKYESALNSFLKSVNMNRTYGKSIFYLATMALDDLRISKLNEAFQTQADKILNQEYDEIQKILPKEFKKTFYSSLANQIKDNPALVSKYNFGLLQGLVDSISLYEYSLKVFSERNTLKAIAQRYNNLIVMNRNLSSVLPVKEANVTLLNSLENTFIENFKTWALRTISLMPATWQRFPDWKNADIERAIQSGEDIYRLFASMMTTVLSPVNYSSRAFLLDLARKEVHACKYMELKGVWGVPDGVLDYLHAGAFLHLNISEYQEMLITLVELEKLYRESAEYIRNEKLNKENLKKLTDSIVEFYNEQFNKILREEDKSFLINSLGEIFKTNLRNYVERFFNEDYLNIEKSFIEKLGQSITAEWPRISKSSVWKYYAYNFANDISNQLRAIAISDEGKQKLNLLFNNLVNENRMLVFERYLRFNAHHQLLKNDIIGWSSKLYSAYEPANESEILKDWGEPMFNTKTFTSKNEVLDFLADLIKEYSN